MLKLILLFFEKYLNSLEYLEILHPKSQKRENENEKFSERKKKGANFTTISKSNQKHHIKKDKVAAKFGKNTYDKYCYLCQEKTHFTAYCKKTYQLEKNGKFFQKIIFALIVV